MTYGSQRTAGRQRRNGLIVVFSVLVGMGNPVAASMLETSAAFFQPIAVDYASPDRRASPSTIFAMQAEIGGRVARARLILMELQAFVEEATKTAKLGDQLKIRQLENDRLRRSLLSHQEAKRTAEINAGPTEDAVSSLTRTIVSNWLETVRLKQQYDKSDNDLVASERSWLEIENRVAALRRTLFQRRTELLALRAKSAELRAELAHTRKQIAEKLADSRDSKRQEARTAATTEALRRGVTSALRSMLLGQRPALSGNPRSRDGLPLSHTLPETPGPSL